MTLLNAHWEMIKIATEVYEDRGPSEHKQQSKELIEAREALASALAAKNSN